MKVDASRLYQDLRRMKANQPGARVLAARVMMQHMASSFQTQAPRDTNRYVRGWLQAIAGTGVNPGPIPPVVKSKRTDDLYKSLEVQVRKAQGWQAFLEQRQREWYPNGPPKKSRTGYYPKLVRQIEAQKRRVAKAIAMRDQFAKSDGALVMARGHSYVLNSRDRHLNGSELNISIRTKVYGGVGRIIDSAGTTAIVLHNREPHTRPVENKHGILRRAEQAMKSLGVKAGGKAYLKAMLANASGGARRVEF